MEIFLTLVIVVWTAIYISHQLKKKDSDSNIQQQSQSQQLDTLKFGEGVEVLKQRSPDEKRNVCTKVILPSTLKVIEDSYFASEKELSIIEGGENVEELGNNAFADSSITSANFPKVQKNGISVFKGCNRLKKVALSSKMKKIPEEMFAGCSALEEINLYDEKGDSHKMLRDRWLSVNINVAEKAFYDCRLRSVYIDDNITYIPKECFALNWNLEFFTGRFIQKMGEGALGFTDISTIHCPKLEIIEAGCFKHCSKLKKITLSAKLKRIEKYIFDGCTALLSIDLYDEDTNTLVSLLKNGELFIPKSIDYIDAYAFILCPNITKITIESPNTELTGSFCGLENLIEAKVYHVSDDLFYECPNLKKVKVPKDADLSVDFLGNCGNATIEKF